MKPGVSWAVVLVGALSVPLGPARAQQATRAGLWQFTSDAVTAPGAQGQAGADTFTNCIDPARSIPTNPRYSCRVDGVNRSGGNVSWTMTCTVPEGVFQSQATAQYRGGTMNGTISTYVPMLGGQMTQRISGRYLGACSR